MYFHVELFSDPQALQIRVPPLEIESSEEELESAPLFNLNQDKVIKWWIFWCQMILIYKAAEQSIEADSSNPSQNERVNFEAMVSNFERIVNAASVQAQAINESVQGLKDRIDMTAEQAKQNAMEIENFDFKFTLHDMEIQKLKKDIRYCSNIFFWFRLNSILDEFFFQNTFLKSNKLNFLSRKRIFKNSKQEMNLRLAHHYWQFDLFCFHKVSHDDLLFSLFEKF